MALKSTVYKVELQISDLDRNYFANHPLTVARHPSETDDRLMVRLLAFALFASPDLSFGKGLSSDDEPALREVAPSGVVQTWIEVGQPDETRIRKGCHKAEKAVVLAYGARAVDVWWQQISPALNRFENLMVMRLTADDTTALGQLAERNMDLSCTVQDGVIWLACGEASIQITPEILQHPAND